MKKVFLALLCAGLFAACGNKNQQPEEVVDTVAVEEVVAEPVVEEQPAVEEPAPAKAAAPAKKNNKPANDGQLKVSEEKTLVDHAKNSAAKVGHAAINKAEKEATKNIENTPTKSRR